MDKLITTVMMSKRSTGIGTELFFCETLVACPCIHPFEDVVSLSGVYPFSIRKTETSFIKTSIFLGGRCCARHLFPTDFSITTTPSIAGASWHMLIPQAVSFRQDAFEFPSGNSAFPCVPRDALSSMLGTVLYCAGLEEFTLNCLKL